MKILLTGYKGFIGSHLLTALTNNGHDVSTFEWGEEPPSVMEQDWVIHVGAISSTTERDVEKVLRQNLDFTINLYDQCKTFGVNFQFSSSASVYGLQSSFSEESPVDPQTPYSWSKYLCERYITNKPSGSRTQIFRYFNVYGPEGEEHKGNQASPYMQFKRQAQENGIISLFENSEIYKRDFIHVSEVVNYHLKFLECDVSGIFNVGTGKVKSFQQVAEENANIYGAKIQYIPMPDILKNSYQKYTCADMTKTNKTLS